MVVFFDGASTKLKIEIDQLVEDKVLNVNFGIYKKNLYFVGNSKIWLRNSRLGKPNFKRDSM